jgi:hypothetical protein
LTITSAVRKLDSGRKMRFAGGEFNWMGIPKIHGPLFLTLLLKTTIAIFGIFSFAANSSRKEG